MPHLKCRGSAPQISALRILRMQSMHHNLNIWGKEIWEAFFFWICMVVKLSSWILVPGNNSKTNIEAKVNKKRHVTIFIRKKKSHVLPRLSPGMFFILFRRLEIGCLRWYLKVVICNKIQTTVPVPCFFLPNKNKRATPVSLHTLSSVPSKQIQITGSVRYRRHCRHSAYYLDINWMRPPNTTNYIHFNKTLNDPTSFD